MHHLHNAVVILLNTPWSWKALAPEDESYVSESVCGILVCNPMGRVIWYDVMHVKVFVVFEGSQTLPDRDSMGAVQSHTHSF